MTQTSRMIATLAAAVVVAAGLGTWAYVGVFRAEQAEQASRERDEKLLGLEADEVETLSLRSRAGTTTLQRRDGIWHLVDPVQAAADQGAVESLLGRLAGATRSRVVETDDPGRFGLADPDLQVAATTVSGRRAEVALGAPQSFDGSIFARDAAGRIVNTDRSLRLALDKEPFDLRDKRLLVVGEETIAAIDAGELRLARRDGGWWIEAPLADRADETLVQEMIRSLQELRATAFAAEAPDDLAPWGLAEPAATLVLRREGQADLTVRFGRAGGALYVRVDEGPVAEVAAGALESAVKSAEELRDRRVLEFEANAVVRVRFEGEGGTYEVVRAAPGAPTWTKDGEPALGWKMSRVLHELRTLRATAFEAGMPADHGLAPPRRTVALFDADGKELARLLVGTEDGTRAWVQRAGTPRIARVERQRLAVLPATAADLEEAPAPAADARAEGD